MNKNQIAHLVRPREFVLETITLPDEPQADFVRVKISHCGVCGTDMSFYLGHRCEGYPISLGHEHYGTVCAKGSNVNTVLIGDTVSIDPNYRCGHCRFCARSQGHLCEHSGSTPYTNRGYAQLIDIHYSQLTKLPFLHSEYMGALVEPLSVALNALSLTANPFTDRRVLVLGAGNIGTMLTFALMEQTDADLTLHDHVAEKVDNLRSLYPARINTLAQSRHESWDMIFEASGASSGFNSACSLLDKDSQIIVLSRYHADAPRLPDRLPWKQPMLRFCHLNGNGESMRAAANLLRDRWTPHHGYLTKTYPFAEINRVFQIADQDPANKKIIAMDDV
ncbi:MULTISPECIES: alcohol dehydrogenase catalytic domain-containing protein [unclassified Caballeronia]|uniref:zinc-dependent alcohol dehydrogenase n=1 Tax=unclassified Caballeronia TaxID=2646786 RepID=UPI002854E897|nr:MULTISPECIES: alcohol dehydrogenase catalytic domain-containing protein [unclassified Caballeronia]MDR5771157.1 alcohol dehydrogenase catalytic domain-containing protein [Caballeronia sp. LZ002]MDR5801523.1 alcohol dehydrogenase catalytic domain-containing protein [Caballeronia sp. LZ001]MDR5846594.1 alcohol dehydrogenase catalytic domain-containing protein [Caballeronia sp. LZ003]